MSEKNSHKIKTSNDYYRRQYLNTVINWGKRIEEKKSRGQKRK